MKKRLAIAFRIVAALALFSSCGRVQEKMPEATAYEVIHNNPISDTVHIPVPIIATPSPPDTEASLPPPMPTEIGGAFYTGVEEVVIFSDTPSPEYSVLLELSERLPNMKHLYSPCTVLSIEEYIHLRSKYPDIKLSVGIDIEGDVFPSDAATIDLSGKSIRDKERFDSLLGRLADGTEIVMCDCNYSNDELQALRTSHPALKIVWRIYMGKWSLRTDDEAFSVMIYNYDYNRLTSEDIQVLKYCTDLHALDLGHQAITDLSVIGTLSELRVLILADNKISDITPLANLDKLQYLELFVNRITDLSPLASCHELVDLNIGWNRTLSDISPIYSLGKLERLWMPTTNVKKSAREEISTAFPLTRIVFDDVNSISSGWRTHSRYYAMRAMFENNTYDSSFCR